MNAEFIDIVHRVVADYGAPDPKNLKRFDFLLGKYVDKYAPGKYRRECGALIEVLQREGCADIDKAVASAKMLPTPAPERIKPAINKTGDAEFIDIVHRVVADYGAPDPKNLERFKFLLDKYVDKYAPGKYRWEREALIETLRRESCADIDKPVAPTKALSVPDPKKINNVINKGGNNVQKGINAAGAVGAEVVETGVAVIRTAGQAVGEMVKSGYEAIGGAEGVQRGVEAAGKVAREVLTVGGIVVTEAIKVIAGTIIDVAGGVHRSSGRQDNSGFFDDPDDYIDYYLMDDDDDYDD
jgi:hypothetical protein